MSTHHQPDGPEERTAFFEEHAAAAEEQASVDEQLADIDAATQRIWEGA